MTEIRESRRPASLTPRSRAARRREAGLNGSGTGSGEVSGVRQGRTIDGGPPDGRSGGGFLWDSQRLAMASFIDAGPSESPWRPLVRSAHRASSAYRLGGGVGNPGAKFVSTLFVFFFDSEGHRDRSDSGRESPRWPSEWWSATLRWIRPEYRWRGLAPGNQGRGRGRSALRRCLRKRRRYDCSCNGP